MKAKTRKTRTISSLKTAAQSHQRSLVVVFTNNVKFVRVGNNKVLIRAPCQEFYHQPCGFPSLKTLLVVGCFGTTRGFYYIISTHSCCKCLCKVVWSTASLVLCVCVVRPVSLIIWDDDDDDTDDGELRLSIEVVFFHFVQEATGGIRSHA